MQCSKITLFFLCVILVETAVLIKVYLTAVFPNSEKEIWSSLETQRLFTSYDSNGDGVIDLQEFEGVKQRLDEALRTEGSQDLWSHENIDIQFEQLRNTAGEVLKVKTVFTPIVLDSMTKFNDGQDRSYESMRALTGLKQWQNVVRHEAEFAIEYFKTFLPKRRSVDIGETWTVIDMFGPDLSSNRYTPPNVHGGHRIIHHLLQMFHPRPFVHSRFPPQGTVACLRAENNEFLEIEFRIHAEYQLNKPGPLFPFWFTPAQFSGRIVIARNGSHVQDFEMEVPNNQSLNVDMEWIYGPKTYDKSVETKTKGEQDINNNEEMNMEVDIGYLPNMRLFSVAPSALYHLGNSDANSEHKPLDIIWQNEISREKAKGILEKKMYPFKEVPYLSFEKAYMRAKADKKLVHSILLWGALDDQSC